MGHGSPAEDLRSMIVDTPLCPADAEFDSSHIIETQLCCSLLRYATRVRPRRHALMLARLYLVQLASAVVAFVHTPQPLLCQRYLSFHTTKLTPCLSLWLRSRSA